VFYDRQQVNCGSCSAGDIAATVLARVVGVYPHNNHFLIDAGALALSKDLAPPHAGYGGIRGHPGLEVVKVTQELGKVSSASGAQVDFSLFPVGSLVEVLPNHNWCAPRCRRCCLLFMLFMLRCAHRSRLTPPPPQPDCRLPRAVRDSGRVRRRRARDRAVQVLVT
jgi:hypothetical protein